MSRHITIKNATIHNLKGVDVSIPKNCLTVITGVSGSGKSSLAFDTLYDEGKKRYLLFSGTDFIIDSTHRFDSITGLSPTVAVEQRIIRQSNPRSTVGTRIKLEAMLAALLANYGTCPPEYSDGKPLDISLFQKNSSRGMCVKCLGRGYKNKINLEPYFADKTQKISNLVFELGKHGSTRQMLDSMCKKHGWKLDSTTLADLSDSDIELLKYSDGGQSQFPGFYQWVNTITSRGGGRLFYLLQQDGNITRDLCPKCKGTGLGAQASHTTYHGKTLTEMEEMCISELLSFLRGSSDSSTTGEVCSNPLLNEIITKLQCLINVGLHHLTLSRRIPTLSGGEIQRLFLAGYIIAQMDSIIFVFDEPTIGLHEVEKQNLIRIIDQLVKSENTVVAVEHDENFIRHADWIIDMGPGAGSQGGQKIFEGTPQDFLKCTTSRTSPYLTKEVGFEIKHTYRSNNGSFLSVKHASIHNLQDISVQIPLGVMVGIAGVSGSGKSSLVADSLVPTLKSLMKSNCFTGDDEKDEDSSEDNTEIDEAEQDDLIELSGYEHIKHCFVIDQKPIGRTRTSCPATYTGIMNRVRNLFAATPEAKAAKVKPGLFSLNSQGGCKKCHGDGVIHYYVGYGNFIDITCDTCDGAGWISEALQYKLDGKTITDVLELSVDEAAIFFNGKDDGICKMLSVLQDVGMGYIKLGQGTPTISGGESQRIKLAKELAKSSATKVAKNSKTSKSAANRCPTVSNLYILDEPTTGLSFSDSEKLVHLLNALVENGNSIIVTEHDPYVLSNCDWIIEMGPGGGNEGGKIIAEGTPADLKQNMFSVIGRYLK